MLTQTSIPSIANAQQGHMSNQSLLGLYPKDSTGDVKKKLVLDNHATNLLLRIAKELENDEINYPYLLPLIITLKKHLRDKTIFTTYIWNKAFRLRNRLAVHEVLKKNKFNRHSFAINNISNLITKQYDEELRQYYNDQDSVTFLHWLQDKFFFSQVLSHECYENVLSDIDSFKKRAKISYFDRFFRFAVAFNTGIGTSCTIFNAGPAVIIGVLAFFNITVPPLGIFLTMVAFGVISIGLSALLIKSMMQTYKDEDTKLENSVHKSENEIYFLAQEEVNLRKHRYQLQHKNLRYITKLKDYQPSKVTNDFVHADIIVDEDSTEKKKVARLTWFRVTLSCIGTIGTVWGVPNMVLGLFGISLFVGSALTIWGLIFAFSTLAIAGLVAYQAYKYDKKSIKCQKELDKIKQKGIKQINKQIFDEEQAMHEVALENENLKQQRIKKIAKLDPVKAEKINQEMAAISETDLPIDLSVPVSKDFKSEIKNQGMVKEVAKTQTVINRILTTEQYPSVNLGLDLNKNGKANLVVEGVNARLKQSASLQDISALRKTSAITQTNLGVFPTTSTDSPTYDEEEFHRINSQSHQENDISQKIKQQ